jgi:hypothetical protein
LYTKQDESVEDVCYEQTHIDKILEAIQRKFEEYFPRFLETSAGKGVSEVDFSELQKKFGIGSNNKTKAPHKQLSNNFKEIIKDSINEFEKDRECYTEILDMEVLEEMECDADTFKSKTLKCECPIIRKTLNNRKAKELDKYRAAFSKEDADWLLEVVTNLCRFADMHKESRQTADSCSFLPV